MYVAMVIKQASLNFLIMSPSAEKCEAEDMELWVHNPSTSRRTLIDSGSSVVGLEHCVIRQQGVAHFDATSPRSVRWSFRKLGSKEQLQQGGEKDTNADSAYIYVIPKGDSELRYTS